MFASLSEMSTRSNNRRIAHIQPLGSVSYTRSEQSQQDTLIYIINYENDEGFAIVGADTRVKPVYAISETGSFNIDDETNPAVETMLNYALASAKFSTLSTDSTIRPGTGSGSLTPVDPLPPIEWEGNPPYKKVTPLISKTQNRVHPYGEYSKYVINDYGERSLTCCLPIAVEILMSHYKWPEKLEGYNFNWTNMNAGRDTDGIARLLAILSSKDYLHVRGNTSEKIGYAYLSSLIPTLEKCGYLNPGNFKNFYNNETEAINILLDKYPLLVEARSAITGENGHIWVIDGLLQYVGGSQNALKTHTYYHCVWGDKNGSCNGYYLVEDHDFNGAPDFHDSIDSGDDSSAEYRNYSKSIQFLGKLTKKPQYNF